MGTNGAVMLYGCALLYVTLIYIRPAEIVPSWSGIPFVDILTVISALLAVISLMARPRPFANLPHDKLVLAFWAIIAISTVKVWLTGALYASLAFMPAIVCYFLIRAGVQSHAQLRGVIYLLIGLNVFLAINGIVQYHAGVGLGNVTMTLDRIYGTGIFNDPNDLGMSFVMAVPFLLLMIGLRTTPPVVRVTTAAALGVILVATYYTNSRGAVVGLGTTLVAYSFLKFRPPAAWIVAPVLVWLMTVAAPSRGSAISFEESSAQPRIHSWAEGWAMLKSNPLTGVGFDQFTEYHTAVAHNSFVHTFAELGLIGAFCFVGIFYWYFKGLRTIPDAGELGSYRRALMASAIGVLATTWFLSRQYIPVLYALIALGACAASLQTREAGSTRLRMKVGDAARIAGLTMLGMTIVYMSIRTLAIWGG